MSSILSEKSEREVAKAIRAAMDNYGLDEGRAGFCFSARECAEILPQIAIRAVLETDELQKLNKAANRAFVTMAQGFPSTDATNRKSRELILEALAPFAKIEQKPEVKNDH